MPRLKFRLTISFALAFILLPLQLFSPFVTSASPVTSKTRIKHQGLNSGPAPKSSVRANTNNADGAGAAQIKTSYGKLPLQFEPAESLSSSGRQFIARGAGYSLSLSQTGLSLKLQSSEPQGKKDLISQPAAVTLTDASHNSVSLNMSLLNSNSGSRPEALDELPGKSNYFIGKNPSMWRVNVPRALISSITEIRISLSTISSLLRAQMPKKLI